MKSYTHPDPDRPLCADPTQKIGGTFNIGSDAVLTAGPVWVLVMMLCQDIANRQGMTEKDRCDLYRAACENLLNHTHEGSGSASEMAMHHTLSVFARILGVNNA